MSTNHFEQITKFLEEQRLKDAFDALHAFVAAAQKWEIKDTLEQLESNYRTMLVYWVDATPDPERTKVYVNLLRALYRVADSAHFAIRAVEQKSFFFEKYRTYLYAHRSREESIEDTLRLVDTVNDKITLVDLLEDGEEKNKELIQFEKQKEQLYQQLFNIVWLSSAWEKGKRETWSKMLHNPLTPTALSCMIVTAVTLNITEVFDLEKALLLFELAENDSEEIRLRAITGILLFLRKYDARLHLYPELSSRLQHLAEDNGFILSVRNILLQFIFSRETEKITRRITEEIIPEVMKITPKWANVIKEETAAEHIEGVDDKDDRNPEWEEMIKEAGIEEKMQELSEMQLEGADVMHSSFLYMKLYPFFNEVSNWFMPFSIPPDFIDNKEMSTLASVMETSSMVCNSDKYSLFFTVAQMPESFRKKALSQLSANSEAEKEMLKEETVSRAKAINPIARQYIQDLYRFFKAHPRKNEFKDIFDEKPEFYQVKSIADLIGDAENLSSIGEFYFNKNYFDEAADIYNRLIKENPNDHVLYQKKGYCLQMMGNLAEALAVYLQAELLNVDNSWLIKKLAHCYRLLKQPENALIYYKKAEQLNPNNLTVQLNIGHCYLELKRYDEALKSYFKVEYLEKNKQKAWRPIAWCSFLTGKYEQALDYFNRLIETESEANATDYLNAGHTQFVLGNYKEAVRLYALSVKSSGSSIEKFTDTFNADIPDIVQAGVKKEDIPFILDSVKYAI